MLIKNSLILSDANLFFIYDISFVQKTIPEVDDYDDDVGHESGNVCHHIIPNSQIEEELITRGLSKNTAKTVLTAEGKPTNRDDVKQFAIDRVEEYVNQDHIKKTVQEKLVEGTPLKEHGKLIHAAISHNPHNLLRGPAAQFRSDDPGAHIEGGLLEHQTTQYKEVVDPFSKVNDPNNPRTLRDFRPPPPQPVTFVKGDDGKYSVPEVYFTFIQLNVSGPSLCPFWRYSQEIIYTLSGYLYKMLKKIKQLHKAQKK